VTDWLTRQGFQVAKVAADAARLSSTEPWRKFATRSHGDPQVSVKRRGAHSQRERPAIPAGLAPVVKGVAAMNTFEARALAQQRSLSLAAGHRRDQAALYFRHNPVNFAMAPGDFAKITTFPQEQTAQGNHRRYGQSNIDANDVIAFRTLFGLPQNFTQANNVIVERPDPAYSSSPATKANRIWTWSGRSGRARMRQFCW